jgi:hypothetical protein
LGAVLRRTRRIWKRLPSVVISTLLRHGLGWSEGRNGSIEREIKHYIIAANQGQDGATEELKKLYTEGRIRKEDFAASLRAHQAAVDETKSPQRETADEFYRDRMRR